MNPESVLFTPKTHFGVPEPWPQLREKLPEAWTMRGTSRPRGDDAQVLSPGPGVAPTSVKSQLSKPNGSVNLAVRPL